MTCMGHCCGPQMIIVPVCRTMPSALLWWRKKNAPVDQVMSKTDFSHFPVSLFICVYVCLYLFIYLCCLIRDLSSIIATDLLQALCCITTSRITTLSIGKLWIRVWVQRLILHFSCWSTCSKKCSNTKTLCIFVIKISYCSVPKSKFCYNIVKVMQIERFHLICVPFASIRSFETKWKRGIS